MSTSTVWADPETNDPFYDEYETERAKDRWIDQHFGPLEVPSARGGLETMHEPRELYSNGGPEQGFRSCKSCGASIQVDEFYDVMQLNVHRSFHDKLGF